MGIVDDLLSRPGLYVGRETMVDSGAERVARIVVSPLPGGAGVSLDYEVLDVATAGAMLGHVEHTVIGTADDGSTVMVIAHTHGQKISILRETDPGVFEPGDVQGPYPLKIVLSIPAPGRLRHAWWHGPAGEDPLERDVAEVELVTP